VPLEAAVPDEPSSVYAQEGSAAHALAELRLCKVLTAVGLTQAVSKLMRDLIGEHCCPPTDADYLEVVITEEMIDCVQEYVLYVQGLMPSGETMLNTDVARIEAKVKTQWESIYGTADVIIADWPVTLHIVDLKYGAGHQVDAIDNPQLAIYMLGALEEFGTDFETVKMHIFQPRGSGPTIKTWELPMRKFVGPWTTKINKALNEIETKPKLYRVGKWCKWCKGAKACPRVKRATAELARQGVKPDPVPKDVKALARVLQLETSVLEYLNQCKAEAFTLSLHGQEVPGFKLVETYGRTVFRDPDKVAELLGNHFGCQDDDADWYAPKKLKTPAQLRKLLKGHYPTKLDELTHTPKRGLKLVPDTDRRPAFVASTAESDFSDGETE
jgi:hypothetical protein